MLVSALVILAVFLGALTRATFGFGEAVVAMPLLALLPVNLHTSASLVGLVGLSVALMSLLGRVRHVDVAALARLSVGTLCGIPLGIALLKEVPASLVMTVLGSSLVLYGLGSLASRRARGNLGLAWSYPTGLLAGALGSAYNFAGAPVAVNGTRRGWGPEDFRGTLQAHFAIAGVMIVCAQAVGGIWTPAVPWLFAASLPAVALATFCGHRLHRRIPAERFARAVYLLVLALGLVLLGRVLGAP
ncbi:MAG: sulfite exporter TauE/SafE family protein [Actinomycetota bacterium]|nr:sulfite exporter TauE/SafE family protein [Actinomycetota bacterium]